MIRYIILAVLLIIVILVVNYIIGMLISKNPDTWDNEDRDKHGWWEN